MGGMKIVISDPRTGKARQIEIDEKKAGPLIGLKIGDTFDGVLVGLEGLKLRITGGTDKDGVPMRPDVHGGARKWVVLSGGVGFRPREKGERRRKAVRGNVVTRDIAQLNVKVVKEASSPDQSF